VRKKKSEAARKRKWSKSHNPYVLNTYYLMTKESS